MSIDVNFMVGGEAGQGVQSVGFLLGKVFARGGYHIFADQDYESRVRGGHNFFRVRVKDSEVGAIAELVDVLIALNKESIGLHQKELAKMGVVIFDGDKVKDTGNNGDLFSVPLERLAEDKVGNKLMSNTVALGAALSLVEYDFEIVDKVLRDHFGAGETGEANVKAAKAGYDYAKDNFKRDFGYHLGTISDAKGMLLNGNEAVALGAMAAGCKFMAAYPMTPVTPIMEYMAAKAKEFGIVVVQPEDEISAINMIIGASYAGVRAMTATSGGGFCLMVEGLSLAGMTETPIVIVLGQRPGPAIGLPTRTEQGELEFAIHAGHGEFPRAVLAPATCEDAFWLTIKAFNLAEKYQTPVILLTDQHLASSYATNDVFDLSKVVIERGLLFSGEGVADYRRHKITESGISPRAFPLQQEGILVMTDSDEHNEEGHLIEDAETRIRMMEKRMRKLSGLRKEIASPKVYGPQKADMTLVGWGSTYGAIREAVDILHQEQFGVNLVHLTELWPFPAEAVADTLGGARSICVIENNATGQLSHLIQAETNIKPDRRILKYDGRPFTPAYLVREVRKGVL
jgi:2-oxoglutarate ferredoxin oxidoreductase subunit alpha